MNGNLVQADRYGTAVLEIDPYLVDGAVSRIHHVDRALLREPNLAQVGLICEAELRRPLPEVF
jgi:hypothetical protein